MSYEIIATLGPGSDQPNLWREMLAVGVTGFRLNTSHLSLADLDGWLERLDGFVQGLAQPPPPLVLDLQGSKWRLGQFGPFVLAQGQDVELVFSRTAEGGVLPVPHADFFRAAETSSGEIVLNDAKIRLKAERLGAERMTARVTQGGEIGPNKGITFTSSDYRSEALNEKDHEILAQTRGLDFVRYAISYVRDAGEMAGYRGLVRGVLGRPGYLIAKLERGPAVADARLVARYANELWLCRGDLGAELGLAQMAASAHNFSRFANLLPVPVLLAGQVLEHMTASPTPTRSEVTTLYDALKTGYRGFVLSDETAVGQYPLEACRAAAMFQ
jgi:pyruvate kinase